MKIFLVLLALTGSTIIKAQTANDVWINEFHYDGITTYGQSDVNEFIELVIKSDIAGNPAELAKYSLVLYTPGGPDITILSSGRGLPYNVASPLYTQAETVYPLSGFQSCFSGTVGFTMLSKNVSILQDIPTAMAIIYDNVTVVQLLSYEKSFKISSTPAAGAAAGQTSTLILTSLGLPAAEVALSQTNHSIALTGAGNMYSQFTWDDGVTRTATPCAVNGGQTLVGGTLPVQWLEFKAQAVLNDINLQWKVGAELNTDKYEVELSAIASNDYRKVTTVQKDLTKQGEYSHSILQVADGIYKIRIKSIDADGRSSYSIVRNVAIGKAKFNGVSIYPNPTAGTSVMMQLIPGQKDGYTVSVTDMTGRLINKYILNGLQANHVNMVPLQLKNMQAGNYVVEINNGNERFTVSLFITN